MAAARAFRRELIQRGEFPGQQTVHHRAVGQHPNLVVLADRQHTVFDCAKQRVIRDLIRLGAPQCQQLLQIAWAEVADANCADFALFAQPFQRAVGVRQGDGAAGPVHLVNVDHIGVQAAQTVLAGGDHILRREIALGDFGRNHHIGAALAQRAT